MNDSLNNYLIIESNNAWTQYIVRGEYGAKDNNNLFIKDKAFSSFEDAVKHALTYKMPVSFNSNKLLEAFAAGLQPQDYQLPISLSTRDRTICKLLVENIFFARRVLAGAKVYIGEVTSSVTLRDIPETAGLSHTRFDPELTPELIEQQRTVGVYFLSTNGYYYQSNEKSEATESAQEISLAELDNVIAGHTSYFI